jgi:hypothetical protein
MSWKRLIATAALSCTALAGCHDYGHETPPAITRTYVVSTIDTNEMPADPSSA